MKLLSLCLVLSVTWLMAGCGQKEIPPLDRKKAATLVSEAEFATTMRDFARAEGLLKDATALCPDSGMYWLSLGSTRMKLGQRSGARDAYKHALDAFADSSAKDKDNADVALQQVYVLALLGRVDDARRMQDKLLTRFPNDRGIRAFVESKRLDQLLADPQFKQAAL
jgi:tetratricopeptide (TPR) repeat protein